MSKHTYEGGASNPPQGDKSRLRIIAHYFTGGHGGEFDTYRDPALYDRGAQSGLYRRDNLARGVVDVVEAHTPDDHEDTRILDIGAGTGILTLELAARDYAVTAVDLFAEPLGRLREKAADLDQATQIDTVQHDMNEGLPFADGQFDAAVSLRANRYIRDLGAWLMEAHRVIKPGGSFVWPVFSVDAIPWRRHSDLGWRQPTGVHRLTAAVAEAGFEIDDHASQRYAKAVDKSLGEREVPLYYHPTFIVANKPSTDTLQ